MSNQRIFIITRTEGLKPSTIERNFRRVKKDIRSVGFEIINPYSATQKEDSLIKSVLKMLKSRYVYATSNWKNSRKTRLLYALARFFDKEMFG